jgi:hypothetical protein
MNNNFCQFTNRYSLLKTLRFELKPIGKTRENIKAVNPDFIHDRNIENAYQVLKPVFDILHEEFISRSLENSEAKKISFADYFHIYKDLRNEKNKIKKLKLIKRLEDQEKKLRGFFTEIYKTEGENFKNQVGNDKKGKPILKGDSFKVLTEVGILKYLKENTDEFAKLELKTRDGKPIIKEDLEKALGKVGCKGLIEGFFTYFRGFNENRENYYSTEDKSTSVASRIIGDNLPKFCDNVLEFENQEEKYLKAHEFLKEKEIALTAKNQDGSETELHEIPAKYFRMGYFINCLSQEEIERYNLEIGNANNLVNRYNQQQTDKDNKLKIFKTLYKQIGCGKKGDFVPVIKNDRELKERLDETIKRGEKFFEDTQKLINMILNLEKFDGIYWSGSSLDRVSNMYFDNWYALKEKLFDFNKKKDNYTIPQAIELSDVFEVLDNTDIQFKKNKNTEGKDKILNSNDQNSIKLLKMIFEDIDKNKKIFENRKNEISQIIEYRKDENSQIIKNWLDSILHSNQILKYFKVRENKISGNKLDTDIYELLNKILFEENPTNNYDVIRNYLTQKPTERLKKLKLNFNNGQILGGWSDGEEKNKGAVLLKKDNKYFVGILNKRNIFDTSKGNNSIYHEHGNAERLILKILKFQTLAGKGYRGEFGIKYSEEGKSNPKGAIKHLQKIIKERYIDKYPLLKKFVNNDWEDKKIFDAEIQKTLKDCYTCEFRKINWDKVEEFINLGDMFVFEVCCKEKALQNLYWQEVFKKNSTAQLSSGAEIFYRPASTEIKKKVKDGYENKKDKRTGKEYILENKRFLSEKFLFHCPIQLNYKEKSYRKPQYAIPEINLNINNELTKKENVDSVCFIGIDRGEKHLVYYSIINQDGEILEQGSLNVINGQDYADKLEKKASNRDEARKNWKTIGTIKELKNGYISQVIHHIVKLALKHKAYIVLESLNTGFKRSRQKIEKSVYQKLELALAKKLNFLTDKKAKNGEIGSVCRALQLTPPVNNFSDIEKVKQFGIILYVRANYTSQTDPVTGWRKTVRFTKTKQQDLKNEIYEKFNEIGFDGKDYYFVCKKDEKNTKEWILWSGKDGKSLDRYRGKRTIAGNWEIEKQDIVKLLDEVFKGFDKTKSLKDQLNQKLDLSKMGTLKYAIDLIQQIRNTGKDEKDNDFILSPVRDGDGINGNHFDSRQSNKIPNGDANGAYNIARKGLLAFIKKDGIKQNPENPELYITDEDWDNFASK